MKKAFFYILLMLVCSCVTLETHIENRDAYYKPIPITIPANTLFTFDKGGIHIHPEILDTHFEHKTLVMGNYFLRADTEIAHIPPNGSKGLYHASMKRSYSFYKGPLCLAQFELVTESRFFIFTNGSSIGSSKRYIRTIASNGIITKEITLNVPHADSYMNVQDVQLGQVVIGKYESRSEQQAPESPWKYHTGFTIQINAEEYGILALYSNPQLYIRIGYSTVLDEKAQDQIVLYIFMAYESFKQYDNDAHVSNNS
jgi:hypothetical protein